MATVPASCTCGCSACVENKQHCLKSDKGCGLQKTLANPNPLRSV